jgi:putative hydrolase of the HAD superfamily
VIRCVAFDLDGVVLPSEPSFERFERAHGITRAHWEELFWCEPFLRAIYGDGDLHELLPPFLARWNWRGSADDFARAWFDSCRDVDPEVAALIARLRESGVHCVAASNQERRRAQDLDSHPPLRELFGERFFSCHLGSAKPEAAYFRAIERATACAPRELLFLDDKPANVEGARGCGWRAEVASCAESVRAALAAHVPHALR